jgi:hypothetical protein
MFGDPMGRSEFWWQSPPRARKWKVPPPALRKPLAQVRQRSLRIISASLHKGPIDNLRATTSRLYACCGRSSFDIIMPDSNRVVLDIPLGLPEREQVLRYYTTHENIGIHCSDLCLRTDSTPARAQQPHDAPNPFEATRSSNPRGNFDAGYSGAAAGRAGANRLLSEGRCPGMEAPLFCRLETGRETARPHMAATLFNSHV